jgi:hypothetical protein
VTGVCLVLSVKGVCLVQEKGNIDLAIQYYTVAIEVLSFSGMWIVKYAMCLCNLVSVCALATCQHLLLQLLTVY